MRLMFHRTILTAAARKLDEQHCAAATEASKRSGEYLLGRRADFLFPNEQAILAYAMERGGPDITGEFEGITPAVAHKRAVAMRCWTLVQERFQAGHCHRTTEGELVSMTRSPYVLAAFGSKGRLLGWCDRPLPGSPELQVRRGNRVLGFVRRVRTEESPRPGGSSAGYYVGELREPDTGVPVHELQDGLIRVMAIPTQAHLAALEPGELGVDILALGSTIQKLTRKLIVDNAIVTYVRENLSIIPPEEAKTVASVCVQTGEDWRQVSMLIADDALHAEDAA